VDGGDRDPVTRHLPHVQQEKASLIMAPVIDTPGPHEMDPGPLERVADAFLKFSHTFAGSRPDAMDLWAPFLARFQPVLRHYRDYIIGECLALAYDDPELSRRSQLHGFGSYMLAGNHPQDRDGSLGSYRDDGSYLALECYDYLRARGR
jgi:hypothetical protein